MPVDTEPEVNGGLHSPPDSTDAAAKNDASDSELSELEDSDEDIGEICPDHYADNGRVPVFKPTYHQFKNFIVFMNKINHYGMKSGIVKVIPPEDWIAEQPNLDEAIKTIRVKEPIKQEIMGSNGVFRQANLLHQRSYNLPQWRKLCDQSDHQPPAKRGERRAQVEKPTRTTRQTRNSTPLPPLPPGAKRKPGRPRKAKAKKADDDEDEDDSLLDRLPTPISPRDEDDVESIKEEVLDNEAPARRGGRQPKATASVSARRKNNKRDAVGRIDHAAFEGFEYRIDGSEYTPERCEELERTYWRTLTYAPPLYGADMPGTLFDDRTKAWNLGKLDNLLDVLGSKIPGVNTAYLYLGMWKATFAWHLEDVDLYSINYNHFGAPKQWYSIAQADARRFEEAMKKNFPVDQKACDQFLRHKTFLISPAHLLQNHNIHVNKVVHHPGEFVITFPYGYHSGYNLGFNCAEAVNFALDSWLEFGRVAKKCECDQAQDSVWIDVSEIERKLRGEKTPEYYEVTDDEDEEEEDEEDLGPTDLPTPPDSSGDAIKTKPNRGRKRKRAVNEKDEKIKIKKVRRVGRVGVQPCCLCPNDIPYEPLLPTDNGKQAHRRCASYIPETYVEKEDGAPEKVVNVGRVSKARMDLKCGYCCVKVGACFQCTRNKCIRAYHPTCAAAAGVFVEEGETSVYGEDGTEYKIPEIQFNCRFHRTKRDKKLSVRDLEKDNGIRDAALDLKKGDLCQFQYLGSKEWFAGHLVENRMNEGMLLIDIVPAGGRIEVEYKWLMLPQTSDFHIIKPSPLAKPIPRLHEFATSRRQTGDRPRPHDKFGDGDDLMWAEYVQGDAPKNPAQVKIDLSKENQVWYYLGKKSTEAKAQFTEDIINKPRFNPKGLFLETIPKLAYPLTLSTPRQSYPASHPNQNANSVARSRPQPQPQPQQPTSAARHEKPYNYKPRVPADVSFTVDPQALQRREEYVSSAIRTAQGRVANSAPQTWRSPLSNVNFLPPSIRDGQSTPSTSSTVGRTIAHSPFGGRASYGSAGNSSGRQGSSSARYSSRPNPFARYAYLQQEHNRSPLEYKSPYMPTFGFMNGYQGNLKKHFQHSPNALLKYTSDASRQSSAFNGMSYKFNNLPPSRTPYNRYSDAPSYSPTPAPYSNSTTSTYGPRSSTYTSLSSPLPPPRSSVSSACSQPQYGGYTQQSTPMQQSPLPSLSATKSNGGDSWEKKDPIMHPAIRRDYMFHNQYQPTPSPPLNLPRSGSDNPLYQAYSPQPQQFQPAKQAEMSQFQTARQPEIPLSQFQTTKQPDIPQHSNTYRSSSNVTASNQEQYNPLSAPAPLQYEMPASKSMYPHQQYFQKPQGYGISLPEVTKLPGSSQQDILPQLPPIQQLAPMLPQPYHEEPLAKIAECPPDVSNCVSHLMANLRKVAK